MSRRSLRRLSALGALLANISVLAWGVTAGHRTRTNKQSAVEERAKELKPILDELRTAAEVSETLERFEKWMAKNVVRGQTTAADIFASFGKDNRDLDRPTRDGIRTISYFLYGDAYNGGNVVFEFDFRTGILRDWQTSSWVCGYCPHILANDGRWRLEGKMLAGRIGAHREGPDTLLLLRLVPQNERLHVRVANWAPEMEYLDHLQLGVVPCEPGCEVDTDAQGQPYVWKELRPLNIGSPSLEGDRDGWMVSVGKPMVGRVIVIEARNTGDFEKAMRKAVLRPGTPWPPAELTLRFDNGIGRKLLPVGTKFLRRIVVPIPSEAHTLRINALSKMWFVPRTWLGQGQVAKHVAWLSATDARGLGADTLGLLRNRDAHRLTLAPMQEVDLSFIAPRQASKGQPCRFVLRMWGYYELLPAAGGPSGGR
jgi:hypothetical protein